MSKFRKPRWKDPRLGVGVLLVAASVALGGWVFAQADRTEPVYRAKDPIAVGESLDSAALELVNVNLGAAASAYLGVEEVEALRAAQARFIHAVAPGELVPRRTLGTASDLQMRPVSITVTNPAPLAVGDVVDLWVMIEDLAGREASEPEQVATGLHVKAVEEDESLFAATHGQLVHVLVPEGDLARVLAALGSKSIVTLVPQLHG